MVCDRLHFTAYGNPAHPPLLLLHGFLGDRHDFATVIPDLQTQFYCLSVDLPGHGQTRFAGDYGMANTAQLVIHLLDELQLAQVQLVGYSMGGRLALYLALQFPLRFPAPIIESASPGLPTAPERTARCQQDQALADRLLANFPQFLEDWYAQPLFHTLRHHPNFAVMQQRRLRNDPLELAKSLRQMGLGSQPNLWDALPQHQQPLLLLVGEHDRKFVTINQAMANLCPTAELAVIPAAGHNVHIEQPEAWLAAIGQFLG
jgi:2-succinyl-6-hydroxy-2,4-cyclohexadiene-1-carboxylate synthase